ncbi:internal scaffolding protein [Microvirus D_HF4_320]|nr:internal scaffolding protein [Microvirus D_HF4_320]
MGGLCDHCNPPEKEMKPRKITLRASTYDYDTNEASDETAITCKEPTLTQQHMKDECDINVLVKRYVVTGEMPELTMPPLQGDFLEVPTYQDALNLMVKANQSFMQQPAEIRARFQNDPARFVDFCSNPDNHDQLRELGLWSKEAYARHQEQLDARQRQIEADARDAAELRAQKAPTGAKGDTKKGVT